MTFLPELSYRELEVIFCQNICQMHNNYSKVDDDIIPKQYVGLRKESHMNKKQQSKT